MNSSKQATLRWTGEGDVFVGRSGSGPELNLDGGAVAGPSPMDALLLGVMACMAIDVRMILEKGRVPFDSLELLAEADRAESPPRYFTRLLLDFRLSGVGEGNREKVQRAADLSRDNYCSALNSLRPDLDIEIRIGSL
jgi:putative redox protein